MNVAQPTAPVDQSLTYQRDFGEIYDRLFPPDQGDRQARRLLAVTGMRAGARVLELGVGNGRVLVPLAVAGLQAVGVDRSGEVLERAAGLAAQHGVHLDLLEHDARAPLDCAGLFDLVICVGATLCMMDRVGQRALLASAASRVRAGGWLVTEVHHDRMVEELHRSGRATLTFGQDPAGVPVVADSTYDARSREWSLTYRWGRREDADATAREWCFVPRLSEQDHQLATAGLTLRRRMGGWERSELRPDSPTAISLYHLPRQPHGETCTPGAPTANADPQPAGQHSSPG